MTIERTNPATRERDADLARIASRWLDIETLERRGRDALDFHDLAVWNIRSALRAAYAAGYEQAVADRTPAATELVPASFACPRCGERDMDRLICDEDGESVACLDCGTKYVVSQQD